MKKRYRFVTLLDGPDCPVENGIYVWADADRCPKGSPPPVPIDVQVRIPRDVFWPPADPQTVDSLRGAR